MKRSKLRLNLLIHLKLVISLKSYPIYIINKPGAQEGLISNFARLYLDWSALLPHSYKKELLFFFFRCYKGKIFLDILQ